MQARSYGCRAGSGAGGNEHVPQRYPPQCAHELVSWCKVNSIGRNLCFYTIRRQLGTEQRFHLLPLCTSARAEY